jgi:hypothetical protein
MDVDLQVNGVLCTMSWYTSRTTLILLHFPVYTQAYPPYRESAKNDTFLRVYQDVAYTTVNGENNLNFNDARDKESAKNDTFLRVYQDVAYATVNDGNNPNFNDAQNLNEFLSIV